MAPGKPEDDAERDPLAPAGEPDLRALAKELAQEAPLDAQRVTQLRTRIANGTYTSDPAEIARKLLELESRLFADKGTGERGSPTDRDDSASANANMPDEC